MNKLIILDGMDKTGKSYFSASLLKKLKNSILIKGNMRPFDNSEKEKRKIKKYYESILEIAKLPFYQDKIIIVERFFPSQICYSIKRGSDDFSDKWFERFEKRILKLNHLYIQCFAEKDLILRRFITDKEEYLSQSDIEIIWNRYEKFYDQTKMNKIKISTLNLDWDKLVEFIRKENK